MQREYRSRNRQLLLAASIVALFIATFSVVLEPDPGTGTMVHFGTYVWQLVPFGFLTVFMVWRALQARIATTPDGIQVHRVTGREFLPWSTVRGFEVHDSTSGRILMVVARRTNSRTVRLRSFSATRAEEAEAFRAALEADRLERTNSAGRAADALA